jgi:hypothetical protein
MSVLLMIFKKTVVESENQFKLNRNISRRKFEFLSLN